MTISLSSKPSVLTLPASIFIKAFYFILFYCILFYWILLHFKASESKSVKEMVLCKMDHYIFKI